MKTLSDYFDKAKEQTGSDRQTALKIGVTANRIAMARKDGVMSNEFCKNLAELINVNPIEIIAAAETKKHPEKASQWQKWIAACLIIGMLGMSENVVNTAYSAELNNSTSYRLCVVLVCVVIWFIYLLYKEKNQKHGDLRC